MSRPSLRLAAPAVLALTSVLGLAACTDKADSSASSTAGGAGGPIVVNATDTACELSASSAKAGTVTFQVSNAGTKVNEFYVYAEGDRIISEVENITPGLKRELKVEITEPGTFTTACKPGMVGDGIRAPFTVTGTAVAGSADQKVATAIADYKAFVATQSDELLTGTEEFVTAVKAGDVAKAKELYPTARLPWETIEPVAESFGDLDPRIDGREDVIEEGMKFTGYHRLEKDLWVSGLQPDSSAIADQLLTDVKEIATKSKAVEPTALTISNGAKALLDEVATGKITGEEERYSHTDLWDFAANLEGSQAAVQALRPYLEDTDPDLVAEIDERFAATEAELEQYRDGDGWVLHDQLTGEQLRGLSDTITALTESVSRVAAVVAGR
jgi:iron uptake system component EfeO